MKGEDLLRNMLHFRTDLLPLVKQSKLICFSLLENSIFEWECAWCGSKILPGVYEDFI